MHINAHLDVDVVAVENDDVVTVLLELTAPTGDVDATRPEHAAVVVLDRSGSMSGSPLQAAKRGLLALIDRLDERDSFGLVVFDHEAEVAVPAATIKELGRDRIRESIAKIETRGSTDMSSGYLRGLQEARRVVGAGGATIILLSDGHANAGIVDPAKFRDMGVKAASQSITTSTVGIGLGYDDQILSELAIGGTGNHSFAEEADAAAAAIAGELEGLLSKTVQAASLMIRPTGDAVERISVLNDLPSQAVPGGVLVELGDFYSGEQRRLLFSIGVPAMAGLGLATVAEFVLEFVSIPELESHTITMPVSVNVVPLDVAKGRVPDAEVRRQTLLLEIQSAKRQSERAMRDGDIESARTSLSVAREALSAMGPDAGDDVAEELSELDESIVMLDTDLDSAVRFTSSSRTKKSRGYSSRTQGGRVPRGQNPAEGTDPDRGATDDL